MSKFRSFLLAVISLFIFYASYLLAYVVASLVFVSISKIPGISHIFAFLYNLADGDPYWTCGLVSTAAAFFAAFFFVFKITEPKNQNPSLVFLILGWVVLVANIAFAVINLIGGSAILTNLFFIFAAIMFVKIGKESHEST